MTVRSRKTAGAGVYTAPYDNFTEASLGTREMRLQKCQTTSTGALLVAETLPAASITLSALFFLRLPVNVRVLLVVTLCLLSYLTLAFSAYVWLDFAGVLFASVSRGLSDITFLAYAGQYERDVLSTWSSGTGVATFVGPLLYSGMTSTGL
ncbi:battenin-like [Pollicipes pollicipes]|uniref:battenin-like n=1 Tax=Pollicipes pollicipes TaxID=41117 RepID=UPI001884F3CC|nr:battenin-like [Pollicipes pollicipes]